MSTELYDWLAAVRSGDVSYEWAEVVSEHPDGKRRLRVRVMRDALKAADGVRWPATAAQMQRVADELVCMLPTPLVIDLVWRQAATRFNAVVNVDRRIVAECKVEDVHLAIEKRIEAAGGAVGLVACVGKYWVLSNVLARDPRELAYGKHTAVNYGWFSTGAPKTRVGVTGRDVHPWQTLGSRHNDQHVDPSQVIRLMDRLAVLVDAEGEHEVDLHAVASDPDLAPLINHDGVLKVLRQPSVPEPEATVAADGTIVMPTVTIHGSAKGEYDGKRS